MPVGVPADVEADLTAELEAEAEAHNTEAHNADAHNADAHNSQAHNVAAAGEPPRSMLAEAIGGPRGLIDSGLPAIVFVIVNAATSLAPAIWAAVGVGVVLVIVRLFRKETLQQAVAGFFGLAIAAIVAARTGTAQGFFLPGILYQALLTVLSIVSLVIGKPYVGYVMAAFDPRYSHWREDPRLKRAMALATVLWGGIFCVRTIVQGLLYLSAHPGWLAVAKIAMGWPLFALGLAVTYWLARRAVAEPVAGPSSFEGH
jgi:hypothetical protein